MPSGDAVEMAGLDATGPFFGDGFKGRAVLAVRALLEVRAFFASCVVLTAFAFRSACALLECLTLIRFRRRCRPPNASADVISDSI
jgi:hypothetical protein